MSSSVTGSKRIEIIEASSESEKLKGLRKQAASICETLGLPDHDSESWRKVRFGDFDPRSFEPALSKTALEIPNGLPAGVTITDVDTALSDPALAPRIETFWNEAIKKDHGNIFRMMGFSDFTASAVIHVTAPVEAPVKIRHLLKEGKALSHLVIVIAEKNAEVTLVEEHVGVPTEEKTLFTPVTEILCEGNSHVKHISLRYYQNMEHHFHSVQARQKDSSTLKTSIIQIGGLLGKSIYRSRIDEPSAEFRAIGVGALSDAEFSDLEMLVEHMADNTFSNIRYRTVLKDRSHHVFNGNLHIPPGKRNIDALQVNNNIILSRKARAESQPNLVTKSESVSCEHGATVGQLDEEAIFFLMARGLSENESRNLLIQGFLDSIIEEIPMDETSLEEITKAVRAKVSL